MIDTKTPNAPAGRFGGLAVYGERRPMAMLLLGFAAGLPNLLIYDTLSAWLRDAGVTLEMIGFFALATLTYALKFVWAPLLDRTNIPGLTRWLGHRRSWMLATQVVIIAGLWLISGSNPQTSLGAVAAFAVMVGFFGATQDIAIDAWRIEAVDDSRQGAMAAAYQLGYRVAQIVAGFVPLALAQFYNWNLSYAIMAALMGVGVMGVLLAPREKQHVVRAIPVSDIPSRPVAEKIEWVVRLGLIFVAAVLIGTGLTDKIDAFAWAFGAVLPEAVLAVLSAGLAESGGGGGVDPVRLDRAGFRPAVLRLRAGAGLAHPSGRLSGGVVRRAVEGFLRPLRQAGRADPGADLPLSPGGFRAEHHEPLLHRPGVQPDRDRRGAEAVRRRRHVAGRLHRRLVRRPLRLDPDHGGRGLHEPGVEPGLRLAGDPGA
nr:MFS transporter [Enterobacter roggenkampii]